MRKDFFKFYSEKNNKTFNSKSRKKENNSPRKIMFNAVEEIVKVWKKVKNFHRKYKTGLRQV